MPKQTKLTKVETNKAMEMIKSLNPVAIQSQDLLPPELMEALESKMPQWLKEYVADGTSVIRWNWEFLIILESILQKDFGFEEKDFVKVEKRLKEIFPRIDKFKAETPRLLQPEDFSPSMRMVRRNKKLFMEEHNWQLSDGKKQKLLK